MSSTNLKPKSLKREGDGLAIEWSDGVRTFVSWAHLRKNCPCAGCLEERRRPPDPFRVLSEREVQAGSPEAVSMRAGGFYAYEVAWNEGHDTGIYPIEALRELSEVRPVSDPAGSG